MIRSGRLNKRVDVQRPVTSRDAYGQDVITWTSEKTVWAAVEPLRGKEFFDADQHTAETSVRIVIRYQAYLDALGFDSTWRIVYNSKTYEILSAVEPAYARDSWQMMCRVIQ